MIGASRLMGLYAVIPATVLLTVSFFVLVSIRKLEGQALRAFGYVVAALLWISVTLMLATGMYTLSTGKCLMMNKMKHSGECGMKDKCDKAQACKRIQEKGVDVNA